MININNYSNRIIVCIPNTWPTLYSKCVESMIPIFSWRNVDNLMQKWDTVILEVNFGKWFPIDANRDELAAGALKNKDCTHILYLDADSLFPDNLIQRLVALNVDMVAALQFHKTNPHQTIPMIATPGQGDKPYIYSSIPIGETRQPVEVDAVGMGATLIRREIFEQIPRPWFEYGMSREAPRRDVSEDMAFCQKVRALGYKIWVDTRIIIGHLTVESIGLPHYEAGQRILNERLNKWNQMSNVLGLGGFI